MRTTRRSFQFVFAVLLPMLFLACGSDDGLVDLVITGSPVTNVAVGNQYIFQPTAQGADDDTMRFTIQNKPDWAGFNETTGRLFGTPTSNDIGTYSSIVIRVSAGPATSSLPEFSITVVAFGNGSATLTWIAPTERTDNTPLTDLAGFSI